VTRNFGHPAPPEKPGLDWRTVALGIGSALAFGVTMAFGIWLVMRMRGNV
jgi:hypothetical protein